MAEYDIAFGEKLAEVAGFVVADGITDLDAKRTVLYLSLLSTEISLKSMLEHAGRPVPEIRAQSHRLANLLTDLNQCEVEVEVTPNNRMFVPATRLRACTLRHGDAEVTVGAVIDAESQGDSTYPSQIRDGDVFQKFEMPTIANSLGSAPPPHAA